MHHLGDEWNLHIFSSSLEYIKNLFIGCTFHYSQLSTNNLTPEQYNILFTNIAFWNSISEENILIFQTDSFIMNKIDNLDKYLQFPFIGGLYHYYTTTQIKEAYPNQIAGLKDWSNKISDIHLCNSPKQDFSINGGFSFRKKSAMIKCLQNIETHHIKEYRKKNNMDTALFETPNNVGEDTYFQHSLELLDYKLPSLEDCNNFCNNLVYPKFNKNAFAIHNVKKRHVDKFSKEIKEFIEEDNLKICFVTSLYENYYKKTIDKLTKFEINEKYDYIAFTNLDAENFDTSWTIINYDKISSNYIFPNIIKSRYPKFMSWKIMEELNLKYDVIIYCDAHIVPKKNIDWMNLAKKVISSESGYMTSQHQRNYHEELDKIVAYGKDTKKNSNKLLKFFTDNGLPKEALMLQNYTFMYNPKNTKITNAFEYLWNIYKTGDYGHRDQPLWSYVVYKKNIKPILNISFGGIYNEDVVAVTNPYFQDISPGVGHVYIYK